MSEYSMPSYFQTMPVIGKEVAHFSEENAAQIQEVEQEIHEIREAALEKIPFMLVVGDRDMENGTVSPRHRADGDLGAMSVDEFSALLKRVVDNKEQK